MTPVELKAFFKEISDFCGVNELRDHPTKYFEFRKKLMAVAKDTTLENSVRVDASIVLRTLSWMFNSVIGTGRCEQRGPDLPSSHATLTASCRTKVIHLASNF